MQYPSFKKWFLITAIVSTPILVNLSNLSPASAAGTNYPSRIISLSPSATEDLFAIGAGKQVIAVDDNSNYPKNAPFTKLSSFTPNVEALLAYKPDLVVIQSTATKADSVIAALKNLKISVYVEHTPSTIDQAYSEISSLGKVTGKLANANNLVTRMKREISAVIRSGKLKTSKTFFHELDNTLYSATSSTFIGKVYADFNLTNIADSAAKADDGGYPQLQSEYVIKSNPDFIFLTDGEKIADVSARPGWNSISAVINNKVITLPDDIPSRWGPRIVDFYKFISKSIQNIKG